ncbi:hypothetical protein QR680_018709 [Steinernema hermaphroditum]|uniref:SCP domain-containing protein n=1 Tax=Steinernema hermaphroditum TaxID=289476 RepID=A0AA39HJP5_9BILA|nr:hypothetical protein QR680_018709 [Steinernema hermaphroditum]
MSLWSAVRLLLSLLLVVVASVSPEERSLSKPLNARVRCNEFVVCSQRDRETFEKRRQMAKTLVTLYQQAKWSGYVSESKLLAQARTYRADLCTDVTTAGFMLEEGVKKWPMACIWNGAAINGSESCAPYPFLGDNVFEVREADTWPQAVAKFRRAIGCSDLQIYNARNIEENYFCRERCVQLGIGYVPQIVILATLMMAFYILSK